MNYANVIREYIEARVKECEPDYKRLENPFTDEQADENNLEKYYHLKIGDLSRKKLGNSIEDEVETEITLWSRLFNNTTVEYEKIIGSTNEICLNLQRELSVSKVDGLTEVDIEKISNNQLENNDNAVEMKLKLSITLNYCVD